MIKIVNTNDGATVLDRRHTNRRAAATIGASLILAATLAACSREAPPSPPVATAMPVRTAVVRPVSGTAKLLVAGTVRLKRETPLAFNTPGRIAAILVREGDRVAAGQMLARLDITSLGAAQAAAGAEVVRAKADLVRSEELFAKGWVTGPRVEQARASMAAAQARLRAAGFDVGLAALRAPSGGVVLSRPGEPGQIAQPGQAVLTLGELSQGFVLRVPLSDLDAARIKRGQSAQVRIAALGGAPLTAAVSEVGARGDDGTGTFRIEVQLPADQRLASGQIGTAELVLGPAQAGDALIVPATAVFAARADEGFVYVLEPVTRRVRQRLVSLGAVADAGVIVTSGLQSGEQVVTTGIDRLRNGQVVQIASAAAAK